MSTITVTLSDEDFAFLRDYSAQRGLSAEELLARQAHDLRERASRPIDPRVLAISGIVPSDVSARDEYYDHVEKKHR